MSLSKEYTEYLKDELLEKELNRMLTVSEAAGILGVSAASIRRFDNAGQIKSYRIGNGRHRRFMKRDLLEYLESN